MRGIIIGCVAHEISHTGQRIRYLDLLFDSTDKERKKMEASNELHAAKWVRDNYNYLCRCLGKFPLSSDEFSAYTKWFNEVTIDDYEYLNSWNEKLLDELDYLFMLNTKGFLEESLKKGFSDFVLYKSDGNDYSTWGTFNITSILNSEAVAIDILKFINLNISVYKSFVSGIDVHPKDDKVILFTLVENERLKFSKVYNSWIHYVLDYPKEIDFIEKYSYKDKLIEHNLIPKD